MYVTSLFAVLPRDVTMEAIREVETLPRRYKVDVEHSPGLGPQVSPPVRVIRVEFVSSLEPLMLLLMLCIVHPAGLNSQCVCVCVCVRCPGDPDHAVWRAAPSSGEAAEP